MPVRNVGRLEFQNRRDDMKLFTNYKLLSGHIFLFWGEGNDKPLGVGDVVYLWQDKSRSGLGEEIIYASALVTKIVQTNYYEATVI